jgi:hypothetical protein
VAAAALAAAAAAEEAVEAAGGASAAAALALPIAIVHPAPPAQSPLLDTTLEEVSKRMSATLQMHKQILERQEVQFYDYSGTSGPFDCDSESVGSTSSSGSGGAQMRTAVSLLAFAASMSRREVDMGEEELSGIGGGGSGGGGLTREKVEAVLASGGEGGLGQLLQSSLGLQRSLAPPPAAALSKWAPSATGAQRGLSGEEARAFFGFLRLSA